MRGIRGLIAGLVIGLVFGNAVSAFAVRTWKSNTDLASSSRDYQLGYVAGADDAVQAIVDANLSMSFLGEKATCLAAHYEPDLGGFTDWALGMLKTNLNGNQAASSIIARACQ